MHYVLAVLVCVIILVSRYFDFSLFTVIVERIFSFGIFRVMSRLSFGIYLLHFIPLTHRLFTVRDTYVMTDKLLFEYIVIDFIYTTIMAAIFHIMLERPLNNLISLLFSRVRFCVFCVDSIVSFYYRMNLKKYLEDIP